MRRLVGLCAALCLLGTPPRAPAGYLVTDLGIGSAAGLNNSGQVVGGAGTILFHAFLYSGGTTADLGTLGGPLGGASLDSAATAVNASGQVVGFSDTGPGPTHAFLYSGGKMTDLGTLPGYSSSFARGINDAGQVVGGAGTMTSPGLQHAFLYSGGKMTDLGTVPGYTTSSATGINSSGQVVGQSSAASGTAHAFLYSGGKMADLGTLGGAYVNSAATAINASGQVVGVSYTADGGYGHAFRYSGGTLTNLGGLGGPMSAAFGINTAGQVVGWAQTAQGDFHAFLYSKGQMLDLNALLPAGSGLVLYSATGINDKGQITADGRDGHAYLLTPDGVAATPEPSTLALLALGGAGLLAGARRRRSARVNP